MTKLMDKVLVIGLGLVFVLLLNIMVTLFMTDIAGLVKSIL